MENILASGLGGAAMGFGAAAGILTLRVVGNTVVQWLTGTTVTDWADRVGGGSA